MDPRYVAALELQLFWRRWADTGEASWVWNLGQRTLGPNGETLSIDMGQVEHQLYSEILTHGETVFVSSEFCRLLEVATRQLPEDASFDVTSLPARCGFVVFDQPLQLPPIQKLDGVVPTVGVRMKAMGWIVRTYTAADHVTDWIGAPIVGDYIRAAVFTQSKNTAPGFYPYAFFGLQHGDNLARRVEVFETTAIVKDDEESEDSRYQDPSLHEIRYFTTLMLMMNQKLLRVAKVRKDRASIRRAQRAGVDYFDSINVIELRRVQYLPKENDEPEPREVDWRYRWIVRGFWRQQYYPSTGMHSPVWIWPYVKGPADRPFKDDQTLFAVVR